MRRLPKITMSEQFMQSCGLLEYIFNTYSYKVISWQCSAVLTSSTKENNLGLIHKTKKCSAICGICHLMCYSRLFYQDRLDIVKLTRNYDILLWNLASLDNFPCALHSCLFTRQFITEQCLTWIRVYILQRNHSYKLHGLCLLNQSFILGIYMSDKSVLFSENLVQLLLDLN